MSETVKLTMERVYKLLDGQKDASGAMKSGCEDYACYCHFELPALCQALIASQDALKTLVRYTSHAVLYHEYDPMTEGIVHDPRCGRCKGEAALIKEANVPR